MTRHGRATHARLTLPLVTLVVTACLASLLAIPRAAEATDTEAGRADAAQMGSDAGQGQEAEAGSGDGSAVRAGSPSVSAVDAVAVAAIVAIVAIAARSVMRDRLCGGGCGCASCPRL